MIDSYAPIIPWKEMGGIKLYSTIKDCKSIIERRDVKAVLLNNLWIRYEVDNKMYLFFHLVNGKLFKMTTLDEYKGKLFNKISVGIPEFELLELEPSFVFDEFEEVFETEKGVFLETDPIYHTVEYISVFVKELDDENFQEGLW